MPHQAPPVDVTSLNFDTCERLRHLDYLLKHLGLERGASVLDVGGYPCLLARAFPHWNVTTTDIYAGGHPPYVKASGAHLPFADGSFDVALACDVLEHVPAPAREAFLQEMLRVSRRGVIVAGPYSTPGTHKAEQVVRGLLPESSPARGWLAEHEECGLPCLAETMAVFAGRARGLKVIPVGTLAGWLLFFAAQAAGEHQHDLARKFGDFVAVHNRMSCVEEASAGPAYRHAMVAALTDDAWEALRRAAADVTDHAHGWEAVDEFVEQLGGLIGAVLGAATVGGAADAAAAGQSSIDWEYVHRLERMLVSQQGGRQSEQAGGQMASAKAPFSKRLREALRVLRG